MKDMKSHSFPFHIFGWWKTRLSPFVHGKDSHNWVDDLSEHCSRSRNYLWPKVPLQPACRNMPKGMSTPPVIIGNVHTTSYYLLPTCASQSNSHARLSFDLSVAEPSGRSFLMAKVSWQTGLPNLGEGVAFFCFGCLRSYSRRSALYCLCIQFVDQRAV